MERWRQIESLFQEALQRDPAERDAYVREACQGGEKIVSSKNPTGERTYKIAK